VEEDARAWIVREDDKMSEPTSYEAYPNPEASDVNFYLSPGAPEHGGLTMEHGSGKGTESLTDNFSFSWKALAQAEITGHRLIYVTPKLTEDLHISGTPTVTVKVASSKPATNLSVYLVSLPYSESRRAKITDNLITRAWADIQNYESLYESEPLEPGKFYTMTFPLQPDDQVIKAGQQIGLMIFGSDRDFTLWPDPGTELTIDLDGSFVTIPVVGGKSAYKMAITE
jgi:X-Pro dipeptidyl-peptidase